MISKEQLWDAMKEPPVKNCYNCKYWAGTGLKCAHPRLVDPITQCGRYLQSSGDDYWEFNNVIN